MNSNSKNKYHYVYRITNVMENKHYYGKRSSKIKPVVDLGKKYFSSSKNKDFIRDQKLFPEKFKYKIILICKNSESAIKFEIKLHKKFDVGRNLNFYNRVRQVSNGFGRDGTVTVKDQFGKIFQTSVDNEDYVSGKLIPLTRGRKMSEAFKKKLKGRTLSEEHKRKISESWKKRLRDADKKTLLHTKDSKRRISYAKIGNKNPFYGKMYICNPVLKQNTRIEKGSFIPEGWELGRKMSFDNIKSIN
jgi:hypothetical protein